MFTIKWLHLQVGNSIKENKKKLLKGYTRKHSTEIFQISKGETIVF